MEDSPGQTSLVIPQNKYGQVVVARLQESFYVLTRLLKIELYLTTEFLAYIRNAKSHANSVLRLHV